MNAFALHDVSDQAVVRRWGTSAIAIVAAHAALIALGMNWYTPAAGARRYSARDHGGHGAGIVRAAADADGSRAGTGDAAGRCLAARAAQQQEVVEEQIAPTPPQEKPEVVAPPEQKVELKPAKPEPAKIVPEQQADAGEAKGGSRRRRRSRPKRRLRRAPRPHPGPSARRRRRPPSAPAHRRRRSRPTSRWSPRICSASSNTRRPPRRRASRASRGSVLRSAAAGRCFPAASAARRAIRRSMPRRWRWCAAPSHSRVPAEVKQASMSFSAPVAFYIR